MELGSLAVAEAVSPPRRQHHSASPTIVVVVGAGDSRSPDALLEAPVAPRRL